MNLIIFLFGDYYSEVQSMQQINYEVEKAKDSERRGYRPIHYLGSKLRLLGKIEDVINELNIGSGRMVDLFSGSGTVSNYFSEKYATVSVDIQNYSKVICSALLTTDIKKTEFEVYKKLLLYYISEFEPDSSVKALIEYEKKAIEEGLKSNLNRIEDIVSNGSIKGYQENHTSPKEKELKEIIKAVTESIILNKGCLKYNYLILNYYGGIYFSYEQALQIDILLEGIENIVKIDHQDLFVAAVLSSTSEVVNTVGKQFAQPLKPTDAKGNIKKSFFNAVRRDRIKNVFEIYFLKLEELNSNMKFNPLSEVIVGEASKVLSTIDNVAFIYADPPYTRYHYSRYYHVLETIALRDRPEITLIKKNGRLEMSRGIYRKDRYQSEFSIKTKAINAFNEMFSVASSKNVPLLLSYSPYDKSSETSPRVVHLEDILTLGEKYFSEVELILLDDINHSKLNNSMRINNSVIENAEMLLVCK